MDLINNHRFLRFLWVYILILGFLFIFAIPPFQKTDEISHYYKTVAVATGNLFCKNLVPRSLYDLPKKTMADFVNENPQHRFPKGVVLPILKEKFDSELVSEEISCTLPFIFYLPSAVFLALPIFLKINPLIIFYLGRLSFYLISILLFYISIKNIPEKFRLLLLSYLSFPMVLIQISSYNKEIFHLGFGTLVIALFFNLRDKFALNKFILFVISLILFVLPRPQYLPFLLLLIPLFSQEIKQKLALIIGLITVFFAGVAFFYLPKIKLLDSNTFAGIQFLYLKLFPLKFLSILFNSYTNHVEAYYKSLIGTFGSVHYYLDWYIYVFYGIFIIAVVYNYVKKQSTFNFKEISLFIFMCLATTLLIFFSMYIYATPVGSPYVVDVQGRYLIMLIPFVILVLAYLIKKYGTKLIYAAFVLVIIFLVKNIYDRYFDYSQAYYYDNSTFVNTALLSIDKKVGQKIQIDPNKKFLGLRFFVDYESVKMTNVPVLITFYDQSGKTILRKAVIKSPETKKDYREAIFDKPLTAITNVYYTIEPFGSVTFRDNGYFMIYGDKNTKTPLGLPIYAF